MATTLPRHPTPAARRCLPCQALASPAAVCELCAGDCRRRFVSHTLALSPHQHLLTCILHLQGCCNGFKADLLMGAAAAATPANTNSTTREPPPVAPSYPYTLALAGGGGVVTGDEGEVGFGGVLSRTATASLDAGDEAATVPFSRPFNTVPTAAATTSSSGVTVFTYLKPVPFAPRRRRVTPGDSLRVPQGWPSCAAWRWRLATRVAVAPQSLRNTTSPSRWRPSRASTLRAWKPRRRCYLARWVLACRTPPVRPPPTCLGERQ